MNLRFVIVNKKHLKCLNEIINDRDVCKFLTPTFPVSMRSTREWYTHNKKMKNYWWAIIYEDKIVGSVNLMRKGNSEKLKHVVEIGLSIDKEHWKMGFGKEAIDYAKKQAKQKNFKRLEIWAVKDNERALRLYRRCGFEEEGIMRRFMKIGRKYCDAVIMSMWL